MDLTALITDLGGVLTDPDGGDRLRTAVTALRTHGIRTALLTNSGTLDGIDVTGFDDVRLGAGKPHPQTYLHAAERLGCTPEQCVFVDDVPAFVLAAVRTGMVGVHHHDTDATLTELSALFGISLP